MKRAIVIVLDSCGVGEMPDSGLFGDKGSDTFGNILKRRGFINSPNLFSLGLDKINGVSFNKNHPATGCFGKCAELSSAKDTTMGHWEIAGLLAPAFKTFPSGFPDDIVTQFVQNSGIAGIIGNEVASGTEIINRLGDEHRLTGKPIVYTSADSVFQIAAHEDIIPLSELYRICKVARALLVGDKAVGRVIARPCVGSSCKYVRTENRKDFSLPPTGETILDGISAKGFDVVGIGKIEDIFCQRGITKINHTTNNHCGINSTLDAIRLDSTGLIFTNLVDFDMLYGHRNDVEGYAKAIEDFDARLPEILNALKQDDLLIITADHGCDPTTASTDHSREYIPVLCYGKNFRSDVNIGVRESFSDIGATVFEYVTGQQWGIGRSFLCEIKL